jgi:hypothetical protein
MALVQRIAALQKRHQWLDQILAQEMTHASPDEARMSQIKKSKLRVKDEIVALENMRKKLEYVAEETVEYRRRATRH